LTKDINATHEFIGCTLRRRDLAQIVQERLGAVITCGVAPLNFVVNLAPSQLAARGHGRKALFPHRRLLLLAALAFSQRRRGGGLFSGCSDFGGAGTQFSDRSHFGRLDACTLGDALTHAPAQLDADKGVAIVKA
jgi:hypothetical protein